MPPFAIIIVTYNNAKHIKKCLLSIKKHLGGQKLEIILIDNNSSDKTLKVIKGTKIKKKLIKNKKNLGFAKAVNQGINHCSYDTIALLNPDTELIDDSIINSTKLIEKNKKIGIIGGKLIPFKKKDNMLTANSKPNLGTAIFEFTTLKKIFPNNPYHKKFWLVNKIDNNEPQKVDSVCGALMIFKKQNAKKINFFDEKFFLYLEDLDFCLRMKQRGLKTIYNPGSQIKHIGGGSSPNKHKINLKAWYKSREYFFKKHLPKKQYFIVSLIFKMEKKILRTLKKTPFHEHNIS